MAKHAMPDTVDCTDRVYPRVPQGDDLNTASAVLNEVLDRTASLQDGLHDVASRHVDAAPISSIHVLDLTGAIARTVLDWIARWPS